MCTSIVRSLAVTACLGVLAACSGPQTPSKPYAGLARAYEVGIPTFDAQVQPAFEGGERGLNVDVSIPELSLVFRSSELRLVARIEWLVRLLSADGGQVLGENTHRETIYRDADSAPALFGRTSFSAFIKAAPGMYRIEIMLEDLTSGKSERKELIFELPARNEPLIATDLHLENQDGRPLVAIHLPDTLERANAVFFLTGNVSRPAILRSFVARLDAYGTPAQSPYWQGPGTGFAGISAPELTVVDTLATEERVVRRGPLSRVSIPVPLGDVGTYRVEVMIEDLQIEGGPPAVELSRYFIIRRSGFPRVEEFDELIPPLIYLANSTEWEFLESSIATADARRAFDSFWGRFMTDRSVATNVVRMYFSRVEEANLRYSEFKEGWKTDRGMVYIILGEPLFIERTLESEIWYYSYDEGRGEHLFEFHRIWRENAPDMIDEYTLERSFEYERFWRGQIDRWRSGVAL